MGKIWMPGGGGGADLDAVTAIAGDVLKGKVIVGPDGEPLTGVLELTGNAADSQVLSGQTYYNTDAKTKRTGTLLNQGAVTPPGLNAGDSYTIPEGFHNGQGKVVANSLASQTGVQSGKTAAGAGQILAGYEAWVNGGRVTGTVVNQGKKEAALNCGGSYTIPEGFHNGQGKVVANSLASQTGVQSGKTAAGAGQILAGYEAWVNGGRVTGTVVNQGKKEAALNCGGSYTIPEGFHNGQGKVSANSLASQTDANAAAGDIVKDKTAWVKGSKITGTMATMAGGTYTPSTSQQTVSCNGKKMTSDIVIPAFSLPAASSIKKGVTITIYGKSVTGTFEGWVALPTDIYLRGNNAGGLVLAEKTSYAGYEFQTGALYYYFNNTSQHVYLKTTKTYNLNGYTRLNFQWQEATTKATNFECAINGAKLGSTYFSAIRNGGMYPFTVSEGTGYIDISNATETAIIEIQCFGSSPTNNSSKFKILRIWLS